MTVVKSLQQCNSFQVCHLKIKAMGAWSLSKLQWFDSKIGHLFDNWQKSKLSEKEIFKFYIEMFKYIRCRTIIARQCLTIARHISQTLGHQETTEYTQYSLPGWHALLKFEEVLGHFLPPTQNCTVTRLRTTNSHEMHNIVAYYKINDLSTSITNHLSSTIANHLSTSNTYHSSSTIANHLSFSIANHLSTSNANYLSSTTAHHVFVIFMSEGTKSSHSYN